MASAKVEKILVIGCVDEIVLDISDRITTKELQLQSCQTLPLALRSIRAGNFQAVLMDADRIEDYGPKAVEQIKSRAKNAKVIVFGTFMHAGFKDQLCRAGADKVFGQVITGDMVLDYLGHSEIPAPMLT